jgi:chloramphenicol 3-O phosphotransferase
MQEGVPAGRIVILNGAPRSGKSSIVEAIQASFEGIWMNLGVDLHVRHVMPARYRPGIGLRPGGERPDLEPLVPRLYAALYESIAAHSRLGFDAVVDVGHHDGYSVPLGILPDCARRLAGLPVLFVGVRCPIEAIMARRRKGQAGREGVYEVSAAGEPVPPTVLRFQEAVHLPGIYDLELDTSELTPGQCAAAIGRCLAEGIPNPSAFDRLALAG